MNTLLEIKNKKINRQTEQLIISQSESGRSSKRDFRIRNIHWKNNNRQNQHNYTINK